MNGNELTLIFSNPERTLESQLITGQDHVFSDGAFKWPNHNGEIEFSCCLVNQFWVFDEDEWRTEALSELGRFVNESGRNLVFIYFHLSDGPTATELKEKVEAYTDATRIEIEHPIGFHHAEADPWYSKYIRPALEDLIRLKTL